MLLSADTDTCSVVQSCLTLSDPMNCSPPGSSVHGIFQARILEWVVISYFRRYLPNQGSNPYLLNLLHWYTSTGLSLFLKVPFMSLQFYERPTLVPVFTNQKESEESFHFYEKETKNRNSVQGLFCSSRYRGSAFLCGGSGTAKLPLQQSHSAPQHRAARALNCVCEFLSVLDLD